MMTFNIDTTDGLTNGARGTLVAVEKNKHKNISKLIIKFDDPSVGECSRSKHPFLSAKYPGCTVVEKVMFQYSLARKSSLVSNTAKVVQYPIVLCFAATAHKFQGQTVVKPLKLVVDLRTVREGAQAYVMLSRVQSLDQLFILESLPDEKIYANHKALDEVERMNSVSKNENPVHWYKRIETSFKLLSLNCRSLNKHIHDIRADPMMQMAEVMCFYETWQESNRNDGTLSIEEFKLHLNSFGPGKGLAIYYKSNCCQPEIILNDQNLQISKLSGDKIDVIAVYRSNDGSQTDLVTKVKDITSQSKKTFLVGDFNLCAVEDSDSPMSTGLREMGYRQLVSQPTHIKGLNSYSLLRFIMQYNPI